MEENVLIKVQEDGSRAVVSSLNQTAESLDKVAVAQDKANKSKDAGSTANAKLKETTDSLNKTTEQGASTSTRAAAAVNSHVVAQTNLSTSQKAVLNGAAQLVKNTLSAVDANNKAASAAKAAAEAVAAKAAASNTASTAEKAAADAAAAYARQYELTVRVVGGAIAIFTALVAVLAIAAAAVYAAERAFSKLNASIISTGQYTGITTEQVQTLAGQLTGAGKSTKEATSLLIALVNTGRMTGDSFGTVGHAAYNAMKLTGDSVDSVASSFARLRDDPLRWADEMDQRFHTLTADTRDHIKALQDTGDMYGAAELAAKSFADNTDARVKQLTENMGYLQKAVKGVTDYLGYVKDFWLSIGAPKTDAMKQLDDYNSKLTDYNKTLEYGERMGYQNNQQFLLGMRKRWDALEAERQAIVKGQRASAAAAAATAQNTAQQDAAKAADKFLDGVNDKTQKQITYQNKLNQLTKSYTDLINFRPNDPRLKGVTMDASGNISGGSFDSKKQELMDQAFGKPKKDNSAKKAEEELKKYQDQLKQLQETIDPTQAAMNKLTAAQDLLNKAVGRGDMTQTDAAFALAQYQAQLQDTLNPLAALQKKLNDQIAALKDTSSSTEAHNKAMEDSNKLLKQGVVLNDEQVAGLQSQYEEIDKLTEKQRIYTRIQKSIIDQTKQFKDELTVLLDMEHNKTLTPQQADKYLVQQSPDLFKGTQKQLQVQLQTYQAYYDQIDAMQKAGTVSGRDADVMRMNIESQVFATRIQNTQNFLGSLTGLMNSHNRKAFAIGKAAAIAQASIDTYTSAVAAFKSLAGVPIVGTVLGAIAAAAAVAAGLANIAQIRAQQPPQFRTGGEFMVGGNGGADSQRVAFDASPGERVTIYTPEQARALARADSIMARGRGTNVTQNLTIAVAGRMDRRTQTQVARENRRAVRKEYERSNG